MDYPLKIYLNLAILLLICFCFIACDSGDPVELPPDGMMINTESGKRWVYNGLWEEFLFDISGKTPLDTTNLYGWYELVVGEEEQLSETLSAIPITVNYLEGFEPSLPGDVNSVTYYYKHEEDGYYLVAYTNAGAPLFMSKNADGRRVGFVNSIMGDIGREMIYGEDQQLIILDPAYKCYPYPLEVGQKWSFNSEFSDISSEVIRRERIKVAAGTFDCFIIERNNPFGQYGIRETKAVSEEGLIFYNFTDLDTSIVADISNNPIGYITYSQDVWLVE